MEELRSSITCKVCFRLLYEPFTIACGHTYCYSCLNEWFGRNEARKKTCPDCRAVIKQLPAPAYTIKNILQVYLQHPEYLPEGETAAQHVELQGQETALVDAHKNNVAGGGLFRGTFGKKIAPQPIMDEEDGVQRCPFCTWELEPGSGPLCPRCGEAHEAGSDSYTSASSDVSRRYGSDGHDHDHARELLELEEELDEDDMFDHDYYAALGDGPLGLNEGGESAGTEPYYISSDDSDNESVRIVGARQRARQAARHRHAIVDSEAEAEQVEQRQAPQPRRRRPFVVDDDDEDDDEDEDDEDDDEDAGSINDFLDDREESESDDSSSSASDDSRPPRRRNLSNNHSRSRIRDDEDENDNHPVPFSDPASTHSTHHHEHSTNATGLNDEQLHAFTLTLGRRIGAAVGHGRDIWDDSQAIHAAMLYMEEHQDMEHVGVPWRDYLDEALQLEASGRFGRFEGSFLSPPPGYRALRMPRDVETPGPRSLSGTPRLRSLSGSPGYDSDELDSLMDREGRLIYGDYGEDDDDEEDEDEDEEDEGPIRRIR